MPSSEESRKRILKSSHLWTSDVTPATNDLQHRLLDLVTQLRMQSAEIDHLELIHGAPSIGAGASTTGSAAPLPSSDRCPASSTATTRRPLAPSVTGARPSTMHSTKCSISSASGSL